MRIALLCETFSPKMGYLQNCLPKYFARLGADVHVVTTDLPPYYQTTDFRKTYDGFVEALQTGTTRQRDGFTLHILGHRRVLGHMRMRGLRDKLQSLRPDVVQTMVPIGWIPLDAAIFRARLGCKLFTGSHHHASVFPLATEGSSSFSPGRLGRRLARAMPGRLVSLATEKCYAITEDCAEIAVRFFGVSKRKITICPLGVDTELFHPPASEPEAASRAELRHRLGFAEGECVCVYTGKFSTGKNPLILAQAVAALRRGQESYRGLFVGNGVQADGIRRCAGCVTHPFVPIEELGALLRAADIGVWPAEESLSMLDAAACGLPIVANHTMRATERLDGNGLSYRLNDLKDLQRVLLELKSQQTRVTMGANGARKMAQQFSWEAVARRRLADYQLALRRPAPGRATAEVFERAE
jgi:glycosyltransferase involved in cell wall biosynthesis